MKSASLIFSFFFVAHCTGQILNVENTKSITDKNRHFFLSQDKSELNIGNFATITSETKLSYHNTLNKNEFRFIAGYDFRSQDRRTLKSDLVIHVRNNLHLFKDPLNSVFFFAQRGNSVPLNMKLRALLGTGYRHNLFKSDKSHLDIAIGSFYEYEDYESNNEVFTANNWRVNLNVFSSFKISEKIFIAQSAYIQINALNTGDLRILFDPELIFNFSEYFSFSVKSKTRYHSTPYLSSLLLNDTRIKTGLNFIF